MGITDKLPLLNSSSKLTKIIGYVIYGFIFLIILGIVLPTPEMTAEDYYKNGYDLMVEGKYEEALTPLNESIRLDPNNAKTWHEMAFSLYATERYYQALESYDKAIELDPTADLWVEKADVYADLEKYNEKIGCYNEALKLNPKSADIWNSKGITFEDNLKNYDEALKCYNKAIEYDSEHQAWGNKASLLERLGSPEAAEAQAKADELREKSIIL